jgi:autotransporter-associated beta strand protein
MRWHLDLSATTAVALLAATAAQAQNATWLPNPGSGTFNTATNWNPAVVPTNTAIFGASNTTSILFLPFTTTSIGTLQFNPGAPAYSFTTSEPLFTSISITGTGIVNGSSNTPTFIVGNQANLFFRNASTAGNATIITNAGGITGFADSATGGNARFITIAGGAFDMSALSTGGMTAGSIEGAGSFVLGSKQLMVGGNNLSTEVRGVISGVGGSLVKVGTGTLTLSGANSYSGGTIIQSGTLLLGGAGTLGAPTGALFVLGSTLDLGGTTQTQNGGATLQGGGTIQNGTLISAGTFAMQSGTVSAVLAGTGGASKSTAGTVTLSGTNIYTGATTVTGGTLLLTGDISTSSGVAVGPNAMVAGTGTAPGVTVSGGTLMPGLPNAVGTLNISGNLVLTSAATYLININATRASLTNVTGTATLNGATVQIVDDKNITKRQVYILLTATGGVNGTFNPDVIGVKNKVELFYDANNVYLCDHCKLDDTILLSATPAPMNVSQVAGAIDALIDADILLPTSAENLLALSRPQLVNALTQLTGEVHTGAEQAGFQVMDSFLRLMLDPFADTRGAGGPSSPLGFAPERSAGFPPEVALAYASVLKARAAPPHLAVLERPWNIWAAGFGGRANISGDPITIGSHDNSVSDYGYATGLDYRIAADTTVGFALAGAGSDWSLANALGTGHSDVFQVGLYGSKRWGPAYVSAALAYASNWLSTDRFVNVFGTNHLTSSFVAQNLGGRVEGGYRFAMPMVAVTPYGAFQAQRLYLPSYGEIAQSGSTVFALTYNAQNAATTRGELGAWFDRTVIVADAYAATLFARAAWAHDWGNDRALSTNFLTLPTPAFIINGAAPPPDKALVSGGSELRLRNGWSLTGKFDDEFANRLHTYAGTGTVRYTW